MLSMKQKAFIGIVIIFAAVIAANVVISLWTYEVKLVTIPAGDDGIYVPARELFNVTCQGLGGDSSKFSSMKWLNAKGDIVPEGIPGVQKEGKNSLKLIFTEPEIEESGTYKCLAVYDNEHTLEKAIQIIFYGSKPTFKIPYENVTTEEGSRLEVNCSALGDEPMVYEWYQYENRIPEDTNSSMFAVNSENLSTLIIRKVTRNHEGMYTCLATNEHGLTSKVYHLFVFSSCDNETEDGTSILKVEVVNITSKSVQFAFDISGSVTSIKVKYSESRNATVYSMEWDYGDIYEVKDLIPGGFYEFRFSTVQSQNDTWSKAYRVTLLPDTPDVIFQNLEGRSVKLEWFRKVDDIMRQTIDVYELRYFSVQIERGNNWIPSNCVISIQIPFCGGSSYTISGLSQRTYYEIQLRAHTSSGYGEPYKQKIYLPS